MDVNKSNIKWIDIIRFMESMGYLYKSEMKGYNFNNLEGIIVYVSHGRYYTVRIVMGVGDIICKMCVDLWELWVYLHQMQAKLR